MSSAAGRQAITSIRTLRQLAGLVDQSLLHPDAFLEEFDSLCKGAKKYRFASVAVNPAAVPYCASQLEGTGVLVCAAVGFPFGQNTVRTKVFETRDAIANGAREIDYVLNIVELKAGHWGYILDEMVRVKETAAPLVVKVILETCFLTQDEKRRACELAVDAGLDFVKTSTGFGPGGATVEDVSLMRRVVGDQLGVKASGGMSNLDKVLAMVTHGATRIGTRFGVEIVEEARRKGWPAESHDA
ncbi:MAG: deoxyribose-phosphate aldolase [Bacillota bacterium]